MVDIENHQLPHLFHRWNRAHQGAYRKGVLAYRSGVPLHECPYGDIRKESGKLTWARSFQTAWRDGWRGELHQQKGTWKNY